MLAELIGKHVLLLQGPVGPFFRRLADDLQREDVRVTKVNLNAGDSLYFRGPEVVHYRGDFEQWGTWLTELLRERGIDAVVLFGNRRRFHRVALDVAKTADIPAYVFEEGYLRPDYLTLERGGVNGDSVMSRDPEFYRRLTLTDGRAPSSVGDSFWHLAWYSAGYSLALTLGASRYPRYRHHKDVHTVREGYRWARGGIRKLIWAQRDKHKLARLTGPWSGRYFLLPLQVHNDFQLEHSDFSSMSDFIRHVVASFAVHSPADTYLVVKHHPMDRPYQDYTQLLSELAEQHGLGPLGERLEYVADLHLPTLLRHARGTVLMNSTVGFSSLHHATPLKVLGRAIFDMEGLTHQGELRDFWREPGTVDQDLYHRFRTWLEHNNQANGNFYKRLPDASNRAGVRWFEA